MDTKLETQMRQCALMLERAEMDIDGLKDWPGTKEEEQRVVDLRTDLEEISPLIKAAPQLLEVLEHLALWGKHPDTNPNTGSGSV